MRLLPGFLLGGAIFWSTSCGDQAALTEAQAAQQGAYAVIDLDQGTVTYRAEIAGLLASPEARDRLLIMRRLPGATYALGAAGREADEGVRSAAVRMCFVGVFEVTRNQWARLTGSVAAGDGEAPQTTLTLTDIQAGLAAYRKRDFSLPTDNEWEAAAGAQAVGEAQALVRESALQRATTVTGPDRVGNRLPTGLGFFDLIGNVWEFTASSGRDGLDANGFAHIRGGSWSDRLATARASNIVPLDAECAHPDIGFRLVWRP